MGISRKYLVAVVLLAVLAVAFGVFGTAAPPLAEETTPISPQQESSESVGHFQNLPTYDSEWMDITTKTGQYFSLRHNLNTTNVIVDITGKQSINPMGGTPAWNKTYGGGTSSDSAHSLVQTDDGGYALAGYTKSYGAGGSDFWLVKTDSVGIMLWNRTYGGTGDDSASSVIQTGDGGYALAGGTASFGGYEDLWLVKVKPEMNLEHQRNYGDDEKGLSWTGLTANSITLYRGSNDLYWNYVRVRIWLIKEPSWIYGDINMDGIVDAKDLYILSRNYGKTFSLLSLSGIIAIAGVRTVKKRKQSKQPSSIS